MVSIVRIIFEFLRYVHGHGKVNSYHKSKKTGLYSINYQNKLVKQLFPDLLDNYGASLILRC